ncbi:MAG: carbohydrate-binding protein [Methanospirillum sp.]
MNVRNHARPGRALLLALILAALCALVTGASAVSINVGTYHANNVGETVTVPIVVDSFPDGLAGYKVTIALSNGQIATISNVAYPAWPAEEAIKSKGNQGANTSSTFVKIVDVANQRDGDGNLILDANDNPIPDENGVIEPGATNVELGTVTLTAKAVGSTDIIVSFPGATDGPDGDINNAAKIPVSVTNGLFTVGTVTTETPTPTPTVTETVTVTPTVTETVNVTPTVTETVTVTPTVTETVNVTPTVTQTVTATPTVTQTVTPTVTPTTTQQPFPGPHVPTARIEAEDFDVGGEGVAYHDLEPQNLGNSNHRPGEGVDIETEGGVTNVAYIRAGEYLKYSIDTTAAGDFTLTLHAANPDTTAKAVKVYIDGVPAGQVSIGGTGDWTVYRDFTGSAPITIPTGRHVVTLAFEGINRINLDWLSLAATPVPTTTVTPGGEPTPQTTMYGPGNLVPGKVQAENFDKSGSGAANAAYFDTTLANEGGSYRPSESVDIEYTAGISSYDVGWIRTGEWLIYTVNVQTARTYTAQFNAANPDSTNKAIDVYVDGEKVGTAQIGGTGSFGTFRTFAFPINLPAGKHQIKLAFPSQRLNLDYIEFVNGGTVTPTTSTSVTGGSFVAAPLTAAHGSAVKFTVTPATGKTISSAWWSFDAAAHMETWNSRSINPTFFYPSAGTFSPLVKLVYTDGSTQTIRMDNYIHAT